MDFQNFIQTISGRFGDIVPGVIGALAVLLIGILVAVGVKKIVLALFKKTSIDENVGKHINSGVRLDQFIAKLAYYLVMLFVMLIVLDILGVQNVLEPLKNMLNEFLAYLPNIVAAGIIGYVGYILSTIVSSATGFISEKAEVFASKQGISTGADLSEIIRKVVFVIVFIPILIIAFDTLGIKVISEPAKEMLSSLLNAIPNILAAGLIIAVFYFVGKYVVNLLVSLMSSMNVDSYAANMGIANILGNLSLSKMIGNIVFALLMFAGIVTASEKLELTALTDLLNNLYGITGNILFGLIILMIGNFVSKFAADAISKSEEDAWLASIVRFTLLGLFLAMGLSTMGIGENIVNLAFGLTLGAVAVAFALSFGLGGREAAGKHMDSFLTDLRKPKSSSNETVTRVIRKETTK